LHLQFKETQQQRRLGHYKKYQNIWGHYEKKVAEELEHTETKRGKADDRKSIMLKALRNRLGANVHDKLGHEDVIMNRLQESAQKKLSTLELRVEESTTKVPTAEGAGWPDGAKV
jgi:hypothetical protein